MCLLTPDFKSFRSLVKGKHSADKAFKSQAVLKKSVDIDIFITSRNIGSNII